jgi:CRP/FNR family transcriptional regulator, dissimilatory nitrate respiration regulator
VADGAWLNQSRGRWRRGPYYEARRPTHETKVPHLRSVLATTRIADLPLFRGLREDSLRLLAQHGTERSFATGEVLFRAGDTPWGMFVVLQGRIRVVRGEATRQVVVHTEGPGGTLADVPLFAGGVLPGTAIAAEPSVCAIFPKEALRAAIAANPDIAFALLARLAVRIRELVGRLDEVSSKSVAARLATYLLRRSDERGSAVVSLGMTQSQLAEELGTVREVIVRELRELRKTGIIQPSRGGGVEILDAMRLSARAGTPG